MGRSDEASGENRAAADMGRKNRPSTMLGLGMTLARRAWDGGEPPRKDRGRTVDYVKTIVCRGARTNLAASVFRKPARTSPSPTASRATIGSPRIPHRSVGPAARSSYRSIAFRPSGRDINGSLLATKYISLNPGSTLPPQCFDMCGCTARPYLESLTIDPDTGRIVFVHQGSFLVCDFMWVLTSEAPPCPANIDHNGTVEVADTFTLPADLFAGVPARSAPLTAL